MILLTGGSGLLGTELRNYIPDCYAPTKDILDLRKDFLLEELPSLIVHAAAFTNVNLAEEEQKECYEVNVLGTERLAKVGVPMIYISTDSVFGGSSGNYKEDDIPYPLNFYSFTKLLGEIKALMNGHKVIRTSFKERPWKHDFAFYDQFSSADYVDMIAPKISRAIKRYKELPDIMHIGGRFKKISSFDLAFLTKPGVEQSSIADLEGVARRPKDTSLDCSRWEAFCGKDLLHI